MAGVVVSSASYISTSHQRISRCRRDAEEMTTLSLCTSSAPSTVSVRRKQKNEAMRRQQHPDTIAHHASGRQFKRAPGAQALLLHSVASPARVLIISADRQRCYCTLRVRMQESSHACACASVQHVSSCVSPDPSAPLRGSVGRSRGLSNNGGAPPTLPSSPSCCASTI